MFFPQEIPCKVFFSLNISLQDIFFWNHPYPPQKSNGRPLISTAQENQTLHVNLVYFNQQIG